MKTTTKISVLSLALIFCAAAFNSSAAKMKNTTGTSVNPVITHLVTVTIPAGLKPCNAYMVKITDRNGNTVAPAKIFCQGIAKYVFYERAPVSGPRMAVLVQASPNGNAVCEFELYAAPVVWFGPFKAGETYRYDLYPKLQPTMKE